MSFIKRLGAMYHDSDFRLLEAILPDEPFVLDVGANKGQSILSIKFARPKAIIHSFEPNPEFNDQLQTLADLYQGVTIHNFGLGHSYSEMEFFIPVINGIRYPEEATMRLEALQEPWIVEKHKRRGQVTFEVIRAHIRVGDMFRFAPDLIKIDVEGVESEVVDGLKKTIEYYSPILLIENGDWHRLNPIILELGYVAMMPDESFSKLIPFSGARANTFYVKQ